MPQNFPATKSSPEGRVTLAFSRNQHVGFSATCSAVKSGVGAAWPDGPRTTLNAGYGENPVPELSIPPPPFPPQSDASVVPFGQLVPDFQTSGEGAPFPRTGSCVAALPQRSPFHTYVSVRVPIRSPPPPDTTRRALSGHDPLASSSSIGMSVSPIPLNWLTLGMPAASFGSSSIDPSSRTSASTSGVSTWPANFVPGMSP